MVKMMTWPTSTGNIYYWDVSVHIGPGSMGDDVRLVQYLLARAPDAQAYIPNPASTSPGIAVADVDGVWGQQTAGAIAWLEQTYKDTYGVIADSVVDPSPPLQNDFTYNGTTYIYKIIALQHLYLAAQLQGNYSTANGTTKSMTLLQMWQDGQCPQALSTALSAAIDASTASVASSSSSSN